MWKNTHTGAERVRKNRENGHQLRQKWRDERKIGRQTEPERQEEGERRREQGRREKHKKQEKQMKGKARKKEKGQAGLCGLPSYSQVVSGSRSWPTVAPPSLLGDGYSISGCPCYLFPPLVGLWDGDGCMAFSPQSLQRLCSSNLKIATHNKKYILHHNLIHMHMCT